MRLFTTNQSNNKLVPLLQVLMERNGPAYKKLSIRTHPSFRNTITTDTPFLPRRIHTAFVMPLLLLLLLLAHGSSACLRTSRPSIQASITIQPRGLRTGVTQEQGARHDRHCLQARQDGSNNTLGRVFPIPIRLPFSGAGRLSASSGSNFDGGNPLFPPSCLISCPSAL